MSTDGDLWSRSATGDRRAFGELFERHAHAVWNHAYRLTGSWASAEDLTSQTFLIAWRKRTDMTLVRGSALPWLYTVAGNLARDERRGGYRRLRLLRRIPGAPPVDDHADRVAEQLDGETKLREVIAAIRELPKAQRLAVQLWCCARARPPTCRMCPPGSRSRSPVRAPTPAFAAALLLWSAWHGIVSLRLHKSEWDWGMTPQQANQRLIGALTPGRS
jgi:RNA polymerase sigma-70 factor (ECF subfamily)